MKTTYWKKESVDGTIRALYKEENGKGYYYKDGKWNEDADVITVAKYSGDYDVITKEEATQIMAKL